jgi:hypothetical protein
VTQATVSRDIAELGLLKAPRADGPVYVSPEDVASRAPSPLPSPDRYDRRSPSTDPQRRPGDHRAERADPRAHGHAGHGQRRRPGHR